VKSISETRRIFIKKILALAACSSAWASGLFLPKAALAVWNKEHFAETSLKNTLQRLYGDSKITDSKKISIKIPRIAEDGAVVPLTVQSSVANVENIRIFVAKNPVPLVASVTLMPEATAYFSARLKMAETSDVIAIVKAGDRYFQARKKVKVTLGGCGG